MGGEIKIKYSTIFWTIFIGLFLVWIYWSTESNNYGNNFLQKENSNDNYSSINEFHWTHMPLTYKLLNPESCTNFVLDRFNSTIKILENKTGGLVSFEETIQNNSDISVFCLDKTLEGIIENSKTCENVTIAGNPQIVNWYEEYLNKSEQRFISAKRLDNVKHKKTYYVCYVDNEDNIPVGEFNFSLSDFDAVGIAKPGFEGNQIVNGTIFLNLENAKRCTLLPVTEIHELFHLFGFAHNVEMDLISPFITDLELGRIMSDIMSPVLSCTHQKSIQENYISCLNYIYSNGGEFNSCSGLMYSPEYENFCEEGWYLTIDGNSCCPEPNMKVEGNYCVF